MLFNPAYYGKFFLTPKEGPSKLNAIGESSFFFGILGMGLYVIMGLCSLPSVGSHMTSKQWQLVYGPVAWIALAFGTIHVLIMGVKGWDDQEGWPGGMPPITLTAVLIPLAVMWLKLMQVALVFLHQSMGLDKRYQYLHPAFDYRQEDGIAIVHEEEEETRLAITQRNFGPPLIQEEEQRNTSIRSLTHHASGSGSDLPPQEDMWM